MKTYLIASVAIVALAQAGHAQGLDNNAQAAAPAAAQKAEAEKPAKKKKKIAFTTGVAKGRDMLNTAISASSLDGEEVIKLGARNLSEVLRTIPGLRVEADSGEGNANYSIRGLPLTSYGSKFLQFQEDGLPVVEFSDLAHFTADVFLRADLNLSQIQTIRGGSASTFASNSPGGVINLISKTGEVEGGAVQTTLGIDYEEYRTDFDYGGRISDTLRFHVGGFYRQGEGPRHAGYDAYKGGQIKANVTKEFDGGYIRFNVKYLDDQTPLYWHSPMSVSGTDADPVYANVEGFDVKKDAMLSKNITSFPTLDSSNNLVRGDMREGQHPVVKAFGAETQFDVAGWTITEKGRFSNISGHFMENIAISTMDLSDPANVFVPTAYATGPMAGQAIADPASLNGNGLMFMSIIADVRLNSLNNFTNDLRASKVWQFGGGKLTTTAGIYHVNQALDADQSLSLGFEDAVGGGNAAMLDVSFLGTPSTQGGIYQYNFQTNKYQVDYTINAPYASANYAFGKFALGASVRYDMGTVRGSLYSNQLTDRVGSAPFDIDSDGTISTVEQAVGIFPTLPAPVDYDYHYLSYSGSVNYRIQESLSVFARYSRGARAGADRVLLTPAVSTVDGSVADPKDAYDPVRQAEVGVKFRQDDLALNLTGFWASTQDRNMVVNASGLERIIRSYRAFGAEFEGSYQIGAFSIDAGATYTDASITADANHPEMVGNTPRHQPSLIFSATPQVQIEKVTVGANFVGVGKSFAQDENKLVMPGYVLVNGFLAFRPAENVQLMLNANNLFNALAIHEVDAATVPANGIVRVRNVSGRTISASLRFNF